MRGREDIYLFLTDIFRDVFMDDDMVLRDEMSAKTVDGWTSLRHIEIIVAIEDRYKFKYSTRDLDQMNSVGDLVQSIVEKSAIWRLYKT